MTPYTVLKTIWIFIQYFCKRQITFNMANVDTFILTGYVCFFLQKKLYKIGKPYFSVCNIFVAL